MNAIIIRELKNYFKNPFFWVGLIIIITGVYQQLSPYLEIHYFQSDQEIQSKRVPIPTDADIMDGCIPASKQQQLSLGKEKLIESMTEDAKMPKEEVSKYADAIKNMDIKETVQYLESIGYYGAEYVFEDSQYYQGSMSNVNGYIEKKLKEHSFSYYFSRKFADFAGLYLAFFSTILLASLFYQDTRKNTYELLHTKPVRAWQYVLGKVSGGFLVLLFVLGVLNLIFLALCGFHAKSFGLPMNPVDFLLADVLYILPNMLMILCVYAVLSLLFKTPLPAVPLLFLYIVYSNMGSIGPDGRYGYYGRPLAIMVRFPGRFFDTALPPIVLPNQIFLVIASVLLLLLTVRIWKRRRVY